MEEPVIREQHALKAQHILGESSGLRMAAERVLEMAKASFGCGDDDLARSLREVSDQLNDMAARYRAEHKAYVRKNLEEVSDDRSSDKDTLCP